METIVQWATILSPIVAVVLAWWAGRSSAKDATKQIESIKKLSELQIEASIRQVELEIEKNMLLATQAKQEWEEIQRINNSGIAHFVEAKNSMMARFREEKPERDYQLYCSFIQELETIKKGLESSKNNLK